MGDLSAYNLLLLSLALAALPIFLGLSTAYVKISVVLGMLKSALGSQHMPSSLVVMSLSIVLSAFIMTPVFKAVKNEINLDDFSKKEIKGEEIEKIYKSFEPWCLFMKKHSHKQELKFFKNLNLENTKDEAPKTEEIESELCVDNVSRVMPAFLISELKEGFIMAFCLLLPFLVVDLVVANILVGLGMFMVSPVMIALPLKILLFVMADGWVLIAKGLVYSYV